MAEPRLKKRYEEDIVPALRQEMGYTSVMAVPTVKKIVLNIGLGESSPIPRPWTQRWVTYRSSPARNPS
jgi:hypothetical protein